MNSELIPKRLITNSMSQSSWINSEGTHRSRWEDPKCRATESGKVQYSRQQDRSKPVGEKTDPISLEMKWKMNSGLTMISMLGAPNVLGGSRRRESHSVAVCWLSARCIKLLEEERKPSAAVAKGPMGRKPNLQSIRIAHTSIQSMNLIPDPAGFNFLGGRGCAKQ